MKKRTLLFLAQAVISIIIISTIFASFPMEQIGHNLLKQNLVWLALSVIASLGVVQLAAGLRWKNILRLAGMEEKLSTLIKINYTSLFLGMILPSSDGYAAIRLVLLEKKHPEYRGIPSGTVIAEKFMGIIVLGLLGFLCSFWLPGDSIVIMARTCYLILISLAIGLLLLISSPKVLSKTIKILEKKGWEKIELYLTRLHTAIASITFKDACLKVIPFVLLVQCSVIIVPIMILKSMNLEIPMYAHFAIIPITQIITLLPVTFSGLGLREGSFVMLYKMFGIEPVNAISLSLQYFTLLILLPALVGGLVMWIDSLSSSKGRLLYDCK